MITSATADLRHFPRVFMPLSFEGQGPDRFSLCRAPGPLDAGPGDWGLAHRTAEGRKVYEPSTALWSLGALAWWK